MADMREHIVEISLALLLLWALCTYFVRRRMAGTVLLDCGLRLEWTAYVFLLLSGLFLLDVLQSSYGPYRASIRLTLCVYWVILALERLQLCEQGVWMRFDLLRWEKIVSYRWINDATMELTTNTCPSVKLSIRPKDRETVTALLAERCPATRAAQGGREVCADADGGFAPQ